MMHRISISLRVLIAAFVVALTLAGGRSGRAADEAAWGLLWSNKYDSAQAAFQHDVAKNPTDADALRGLGWVSYYRDDDVATIHYWSKAVTLAPNSWTSVAIWSTLTTLAAYDSNFGPLAPAARAVLASPATPPGFKLSARMFLSQQSAGSSPGQVAMNLKSLGVVTDWRMIGPFDNVSKSGFDKVFTPETGVHFADAVSGKEDQTLKWRRCPLVGNDGSVVAATFLGDREPDVFYSASAVELAGDTDATLALNASGASRLYLNGVQVFADSVMRQPESLTPEMFDVPVHLHKGWNTLLLKSADDDSHGAQFQVAIVGSDGVGIHFDNVDSSKADGMTVTPPPAPLPDDDGPRPATWMSRQLTKYTPDSIEATLLLGHDLDSGGDFQDAEDLLHASITLHPNCAALYWELSLALFGDDQADDARAALTTARQMTHGLATAEVAYVDDQKSSATTADRVKILQALARQFPNSDSISMDLASALQSDSSDEEAYRIARKTYDQAHSANDLQQLVSDYTPSDKQEVIDALLKHIVLTEPSNQTALRLYADQASSRQDFADAISAYAKTAVMNPADPTILESIATQYQSAGNMKSALRLLAQVASDEPQDSATQEEYAEALETAGRVKDAITYYTLAIALNPAQVTLRDKLQLLTGQKPVLDLVPALPTPDLQKLRGVPASGAPTTVNVIDEAREVVYPDYSTLTRVHEVIKINDQSAADRYQSFPLEQNASTTNIVVENARVIKADGKIEDHTDSAGGDGGDDSSGQSIAFPSLAPGDIIDVTYRAEDHFKGALAHAFWSNWTFGDPEAQTVHSRFVLITPAGMTYTFVAHNGAPAPLERNVGSWKIRQWDMVNTPFEKQEVLSPSPDDWMPWLDISTIKTWGDVVQWYEDLSKPLCVPDAIIRSKAADLTKGLTSDDDKIKAIYHYVSHDIQYQSTPFRLSAYVPTEGKKVIRERYGDCKDKAALMTSMLGSIGITSHMVLLSPHEFGVVPKLPSPRFAHAIALVDAPGGPIFIDGTTDGLSYRDLPLQDQNVPALVIRPDVTDLQTIPSLPIEDQMNLNYTGKIAADGSATMVATITFKGAGAWLFRSILKEIPADKKDEMLQGVTSKLMEGMKYDSGSLNGMDDLEGPVVITINCHDDQFATPAGSFLLFGLPWSGDYSENALDAATAPGRLHDIDMSEDRGITEISLALTLPDGYTPQEVPPHKTMTSDWGTADFTYDVQGNVLTGHMVSTKPGGTISLADLSKFAVFDKQVEDQASAKMVLKKS